jgi:hypothetical protein
VNRPALTGPARHAVLALLLAVAVPAQMHAQQPAPAKRTLTLEDAFRLAEPASDDVRLAQNAVVRAKGQYY